MHFYKQNVYIKNNVINTVNLLCRMWDKIKRYSKKKKKKKTSIKVGSFWVNSQITNNLQINNPFRI